MDMGILQWSRHHRLFPGQGDCDLVDFLGVVLGAGYEGPLSLEVFNDVFRQSEPHRTAVDALRSLLALQEQLARRKEYLDQAQRRRLAQPPAAAAETVGLTHIDHVALTQPFDSFDEAALFYRSVLGLEPQSLIEFAAPIGMLRSRAMKNDAGSVRIPLSVTLLRRAWTPGQHDPQHIAFGCTDIFTAARVLHAHGAPLLVVPDNYYDDLDARLRLPSDLLAALRENSILYDRDADGEFFQLYTEVLGSRVFCEIVQRVGGYDGYGAVNTPVHMAAHHRLRVAKGQ